MMNEKYIGKGNAAFFTGNLLSDDGIKNHLLTWLKIEFFDERFVLKASLENYHYSAAGKVHGPNFFKGPLVLDEEVVGEVSFSCYTNSCGCVLEGGWHEEGYEDYKMWAFLIGISLESNKKGHAS